MSNGYEKVTIVQVKKEIKEKGVFKGFAVGNKVNPSHFFNGWCLANVCEFHTVEEVDRYRNNALYYLDKELGDNIAWYRFK